MADRSNCLFYIRPQDLDALVQAVGHEPDEVSELGNHLAVYFDHLPGGGYDIAMGLDFPFVNVADACPGVYEAGIVFRAGDGWRDEMQADNFGHPVIPCPDGEVREENLAAFKDTLRRYNAVLSFLADTDHSAT